METEFIHETNRNYWNKNADLWFGTTALPTYGVNFVTEDELHLFGDVSGKKLLEVCCGSGHSLKYHADRNAAELWGMDISASQLKNAQAYLKENGYTAKLVCSPMEADTDIPKDYFDFVYSIYGIGWTTDLGGTFEKIASYLKKGGEFIFSWNHPLYYCAGWSFEEWRHVTENGKIVFATSYFDESYFRYQLHGARLFYLTKKCPHT